MENSYLSRDEATQIEVNVLGKCHTEKRQSRFYSRHDVTVSCKGMIPSLGFSSWQLTLDLLIALGVKGLCLFKALV